MVCIFSDKASSNNCLALKHCHVVPTVVAGDQLCCVLIEEGLRQKRKQRSLLLVRGRTWMLHNHLAARMIGTKVFGRTFNLVGWWFSMVWTGWSSIFPKYPFHQVAVFLFILFFKSYWWEIAIAARTLINSVPQTTTFAFSCGCFLPHF